MVVAKPDQSALCVPDTRGRTGPILIVEDEVDLRNTYERILRRLNFDVIAVERAAEGLRVAESRRICLVITDLRLPDMDGIALIRALRARADPPPIIVASGLDSGATRRTALDAGAIAYLTKPFSLATLTAKVQDILSGGL
jgi:DNA-binding response OmpR family regulator